MRFYLLTDMEGVAGVTSWEEREDLSPEAVAEREEARRLLTGETRAAVEGLFAGGAGEVLVNDGHGYGRSLEVERLDPRTQVIHGGERPTWLPYLDERCAATGAIGVHAKAGTEGACLAHTMHRRIKDWRFNDLSLGEIGLMAALAGEMGIPFVFVAGDVWACWELETLIPGVVTVPVKWGISELSARSLMPAEAQRRIREGARQALRRAGEVEPFRLGRPVHFRDERHEDTWDPEAPMPGFRVLDPRTREAEAESVGAMLSLIYGYDPAWRPEGRQG